MKRTKKILAMLLCAVLLVTGTVAVTVAYLTSTTKVVTNTFSAGKVEISLDEEKVDEYGNSEGSRTESGNEYKLLPGHKYLKDPTVTVKADSETSYVRMIVTITDFSDVKEVFGDDFLPQNFVEGWNDEIWLTTGVVAEKGNTATYEFRYYTTVSTADAAAKTLEPLFTHIVVPGTVSNDKLLLLEDMDIKIEAHAIQADGFVDTTAEDGTVTTAEDNAWAAFTPNSNN